MFSVHYESIFSLGGSTHWNRITKKKKNEIADLMRCGNVFSYRLKCVFSMNSTSFMTKQWWKRH